MTEAPCGNEHYLVQAQSTSGVPFAEFEKQVGGEHAGLAGNKKRLPGFFNRERK
jgi:hypothetical protein